MYRIFKNLDLKDKIKLAILIIIGAASEPLIAYAYILLGSKISEVDNVNIISNILAISYIIIIALIIAGINYIGIDLIMNNIVTTIRKKIFKKILNKNASEIVKNERATYYNDILKKIDIWKFRYLKSVIDVVEKSLQILFIFIFMIIIDIRIAVIAAIFLLPLVLNNILFPRKIKKSYDKYLEKDSEQLKRMKEYLDAILIIKNNNEEKEYLDRMKKVFDEQNYSWKQVSILNNLSAFIANSGVILSQISGIFISLSFYTNGYITVGKFIALMQLTMFINQPVIALINAVIGINSMKEINKYIENNNDEIEIDTNLDEQINFKKIKIRNLNYQYIKGENIFLNNVNINFENGKKYLIIGESGSGKSTLAKILMKYFNDFIGDIEIDNISLRNISEKIVNKNIFYIPQKVFIFNDTVRDNIDIKKLHTDDKIINVIKEMHLENIINNDSGLATIIGEEINSLSGGEAARLHIVKAKLSNKKIIIADEILSNLDKENSLNVETLLLSLKEKTLIHIAHNYNFECYGLYDEVLKLG